MRDGFIRVGASVCEVRVGDPAFNREQIVEAVFDAAEDGIKILCFPELALSGFTCGDLFYQESLTAACRRELVRLAVETQETDVFFAVGLPFALGGAVYDAAAILHRGCILGIVPRDCLNGEGGAEASRVFSAPAPERRFVTLTVPAEEEDEDDAVLEIPFGTDILFDCDTVQGLTVGVAVGEDARAPYGTAQGLAESGALLILNPCAHAALAGSRAQARKEIEAESSRLLCAFVTAGAGAGETTTDLVYDGRALIAECGEILACSERRKGMAVTQIDACRLIAERRRAGFGAEEGEELRIVFALEECETLLTHIWPASPFLPEDDAAREDRCEEVFRIQVEGLKERMKKIGCTRAVLGISGGLDSTLALLVTAQAFDEMRLSRDRILAVTMPCFGTTDRTYVNACEMSRRLGVTLREIPISDAVRVHFRDIGLDEEERGTAYENAQARERTQILMDLANLTGGMVIGTGDLSELALGWATYNGDHMSMYDVNGSVPKTLVRALVLHQAIVTADPALSRVLEDVAETPVSPELLPSFGEEMEQKTEDIIGPYELHDFTLYHMLRYGTSPRRIFRMAQEAFAGKYSRDTILRWMKVFYKRFFAQQFKRSCMPDGPAVGCVTLSPRSGWVMPSDAVSALWLREIEALSPED
ncbi:MAG: NAD(+) synthase [Lachnospiraceae bacterium]|nr:NAD(+) synthase [Lachnospiraceae bacterium]